MGEKQEKKKTTKKVRMGGGAEGHQTNGIAGKRRRAIESGLSGRCKRSEDTSHEGTSEA
jgi:hypothetical protein